MYPLLHEKAVEKVLESMRTGQPVDGHPLGYFLGVRLRLDLPHVVSGDVALQVAILNHVSQTILDQLTTLRALYALPPADHDCFAFNLSSDFEQGNVELEAWSLLYHRYVCVNRDLSMQDIAQEVHQDERTLRRRHQLGVQRLTWLLVTNEQELRRSKKQERLHLSLPIRYGPRFFGNNSLITTGLHVLLEADPPRHLALYGPSGIGKTSLAHLLANELIETELFDDVLWLNVSNRQFTTAALLAELANGLEVIVKTEAPQQALRAYLLDHPTLIVIDGAEYLLNDKACAETVLSMLNSASVILTSRLKPEHYLWLYHITVPELSREQAFAFLDHLAEHDIPRRAEASERFESIWKSAGGNLLALQLLYNATNTIPLSGALRNTTIDHIYQEVWEKLGAVERKLWIMPLLFPNTGLCYESAQQMLGLDANTINKGLTALANSALINVQQWPDGPRYTLSPTIANMLLYYIEQDLPITAKYSLHAFIQDFFELRIQDLVENPTPKEAVSLLQLSQHLDFPGSILWQHAYDLAPQIIEGKHWHPWVEHLTWLLGYDLEQDCRAWIYQALGAALRGVGRLDEAKKVLNQALAYFVESTHDRAAVLTELSVVYRYQGEWRAASQCAEQALTIYNQIEESTGIERCVHELGQLTLESGAPAHTLAWLSRLEHWTARTWGIASQAYLALGQFDQALRAAEKLLSLIPMQNPNHGRAIATLGQICDGMGNSKAAVEYLLLAVEFLDEMKDPLGYARACNNLAVAYSKQRSHDRTVPSNDIQKLLSKALHIQEHVGDELGAAVTRQNLLWLETY